MISGKIKILNKKIKAHLIALLNIIPLSSALIGTPRKNSTSKVYIDRGGVAIRALIKFDSYKIEIKEPVLNNLKQKILFTSLQNHLIPEQFILKLLNGRVWGVNGAIISKDDVFICDVSREFGVKENSKDHSIFNIAFQKKTTKVKGNIAVVSTAGCNVYYHWILDVLPRLIMLKETDFWNDIDFFVVNYTGLSFQKETLEFLGVDESKIIRSNNNWDFHIEAEVLFTTSLSSKLNEINKFQCELLRKYFITENTTKENSRKIERIYISRKHAGNRLVVNEVELVEYLYKYGFTMVEMEHLSVAEQINLFNNAQIVIGPHGSAFTNIIFCKPGSTLIDIMPSSNIVSCFYGIALHLNINYFAFIDEAISIDASFQHDNIKVDLKQFIPFLESALVSIN